MFRSSPTQRCTGRARDSRSHRPTPRSSPWHRPPTIPSRRRGRSAPARAGPGSPRWLQASAGHVLERARRTPGATEVSRVQLWPEHFDPAFEMGSSEDDARASYGASAGDSANPEPYLYIAAWGSIETSDPFWNETTFNGASLGYRTLLEADDPYATALAFVHEGYRKLTT